MKGINLELTKWQTEMLAPLFSEIRNAYGECGILAQVWQNKDHNKNAFMEIRILDRDQCETIRAAVGTKIGKIPSGKSKIATVLVPEGTEV